MCSSVFLCLEANEGMRLHNPKNCDPSVSNRPYELLTIPCFQINNLQPPCFEDKKSLPQSNNFQRDCFSFMYSKEKGNYIIYKWKEKRPLLPYKSYVTDMNKLCTESNFSFLEVVIWLLVNWTLVQGAYKYTKCVQESAPMIKASHLDAICPWTIVYGYIELKLSYLKNLKLFLE